MNSAQHRVPRGNRIPQRRFSSFRFAGHHRRQPREKIDFQLDANGLYRKRTPRDGSSLFRVAAEQIFKVQGHHPMVRAACVRYLARNARRFQNAVRGEFKDYLEKMRLPETLGTLLEIQAMSELYEHDFLLYRADNADGEPQKLTDHGYAQQVLLFDGGCGHFDSILSKEDLTNCGIAQAVVYEVVYGKVFGMGDSIHSYGVLMLNPTAAAATPAVNRDNWDEEEEQWDDGDQSVDEEGEEGEEDQDQPDLVQRPLVDPVVRKLYEKYGAPFPYKIVKSFQPHIYRNVSFDIWLEKVKEIKRMNNGIGNGGLRLGDRVMVAWRADPEKEDADEVIPGFVQRFSDKGEVDVYLMSKKHVFCAVPLSWIKAAAESPEVEPSSASSQTVSPARSPSSPSDVSPSSAGAVRRGSFQPPSRFRRNTRFDQIPGSSTPTRPPGQSQFFYNRNRQQSGPPTHSPLYGGQNFPMTPPQIHQRYPHRPPHPQSYYPQFTALMPGELHFMSGNHGSQQQQALLPNPPMYSGYPNNDALVPVQPQISFSPYMAQFPPFQAAQTVPQVINNNGGPQPDPPAAPSTENGQSSPQQQVFFPPPNVPLSAPNFMSGTPDEAAANHAAQMATMYTGHAPLVPYTYVVWMPPTPPGQQYYLMQ